MPERASSEGTITLRPALGRSLMRNVAEKATRGPQKGRRSLDSRRCEETAQVETRGLDGYLDSGRLGPPSASRGFKPSDARQVRVSPRSTSSCLSGQPGMRIRRHIRGSDHSLPRPTRSKREGPPWAFGNDQARRPGRCLRKRSTSHRDLLHLPRTRRRSDATVERSTAGHPFARPEAETRLAGT